MTKKWVWVWHRHVALYEVRHSGSNDRKWGYIANLIWYNPTLVLVSWPPPPPHPSQTHTHHIPPPPPPKWPSSTWLYINTEPHLAFDSCYFGDHPHEYSYEWSILLLWWLSSWIFIRMVHPVTLATLLMNIHKNGPSYSFGDHPHQYAYEWSILLLWWPSWWIFIRMVPATLVTVLMNICKLRMVRSHGVCWLTCAKSLATPLFLCAGGTSVVHKSTEPSSSRLYCRWALSETHQGRDCTVHRICLKQARAETVLYTGFVWNKPEQRLYCSQDLSETSQGTDCTVHRICLKQARAETVLFTGFVWNTPGQPWLQIDSV